MVERQGASGGRSSQTEEEMVERQGASGGRSSPEDPLSDQWEMGDECMCMHVWEMSVCACMYGR